MTLFIDTHLDKTVLILYKDGKIIEKKEIENKQHSEVIMPNLESLLDNKKIDSIIVVNGPGSFTGVRLGVTIAKTLAYTLEIPIRVVSFLECLAVSNDEKEKIVGFNDNNGYYIGNFKNYNELNGEYNYLTNKDFEEFNKNNEVILSIIPDYEKIIKYSLEKNPINPHSVNPIYVKKLDVEK